MPVVAIAEGIFAAESTLGLTGRLTLAERTNLPRAFNARLYQYGCLGLRATQTGHPHCPAPSTNHPSTPPAARHDSLSPASHAVTGSHWRVT